LLVAVTIQSVLHFVSTGCTVATGRFRRQYQNTVQAINAVGTILTVTAIRTALSITAILSVRTVATVTKIMLSTDLCAIQHVIAITVEAGTDAFSTGGTMAACGFIF